MTVTFLILGQRLYLPGLTSGEPWRSVKLDHIESATAHIIENATSKRIRLIYDPAILATEEVEVPKADRATLRQIPELREVHAALAADHLGWGFQEHWTGGNGSKTLLHSESVTGLVTLLDRLRQAGFRVEGAWPATSLGFGRFSAGSTSACMILDADEAFVYIEAKGNRIPIKFPGGINAVDRDHNFWEELKGRIELHGMLTNSSTDVLVWSNVGDGQKLAELCEWWGGWNGTVRIRVASFDELPSEAAKLSTRSTANLITAFPQPFDSTPFAKVVVAVCALYALVFSGVRLLQVRRVERQADEVQATVNDRTAQLDGAKRRKAEIERLSSMYGEDVAVAPPSRKELLLALGESLSSNLSVSEFNITPEGVVRISGVAWQVTTDANRAAVLDPVLDRLRAAATDFTIVADKTSYDAEKRQWVISGSLTRKATPKKQEAK